METSNETLKELILYKKALKRIVKNPDKYRVTPTPSLTPSPSLEQAQAHEKELQTIIEEMQKKDGSVSSKIINFIKNTVGATGFVLALYAVDQAFGLGYSNTIMNTVTEYIATATTNYGPTIVGTAFDTKEAIIVYVNKLLDVSLVKQLFSNQINIQKFNDTIIKNIINKTPTTELQVLNVTTYLNDVLKVFSKNILKKVVQLPLQDTTAVEEVTARFYRICTENGINFATTIANASTNNINVKDIISGIFIALSCIPLTMPVAVPFAVASMYLKGGVSGVSINDCEENIKKIGKYFLIAQNLSKIREAPKDLIDVVNNLITQKIEENDTLNTTPTPKKPTSPPVYMSTGLSGQRGPSSHQNLLSQTGGNDEIEEFDEEFGELD